MIREIANLKETSIAVEKPLEGDERNPVKIPIFVTKGQKRKEATHQNGKTREKTCVDYEQVETGSGN